MCSRLGGFWGVKVSRVSGHDGRNASIVSRFADIGGRFVEVLCWNRGAEYLKESFEVYHNIPRIPISPLAISVILMVQVPFLAGALSHEGLSNFARV